MKKVSSDILMKKLLCSLCYVVFYVDINTQLKEQSSVHIKLFVCKYTKY